MFGKVLEKKIIASALRRHLEIRKLISTKPFGFCGGKFASDLMMVLTSKWQEALSHGDDTAVMALDKVWHSGLLAKLKSYGNTGAILPLFDNHLTERESRVVLNGRTSKHHKLGVSAPQGCVLGPILWNIFFDDLFDLIP